jgi:hypothetical protein
MLFFRLSLVMFIAYKHNYLKFQLIHGNKTWLLQLPFVILMGQSQFLHKFNLRNICALKFKSKLSFNKGRLFRFRNSLYYYYYYYYYYLPPLWSSGHSSWLQIHKPWFHSRRYHIFWEVVRLERGPLSLVSTTEELLERKSSELQRIWKEAVVDDFNMLSWRLLGASEETHDK